MVKTIYFDCTNERGGGGAAAIPDTPIAPRVLDYGSPIVHHGAVGNASPSTNGRGGNDTVSYF